MKRRDFLKIGSASLVFLTGCSQIGRQLAQGELPQSLMVPSAGNRYTRLLNRGGYGARPMDWQTIEQLGFEGYLNKQLNPQELDNTAAQLFIRNLTAYHMDNGYMLHEDEEDLVDEINWLALSQRLYSTHQLYEASVEFWSDHFHIYLHKNEFMPALKLADERDVIRPHALGNFRQMLEASAKSPAMLVYLDNIENFKAEPNENYARELLELHTLGVYGGYTQTDVQEVSRVLTGFNVTREGLGEGLFEFLPDEHDVTRKTVLGQTISAQNGETELTQLLDMLTTHDSTAQFVATKLVRRFVADTPPPTLVNQVAEQFLATNGEIKPLLQTIFLSDEFGSGDGVKLKRPLHFMLSTLRALHADVGQSRPLMRWLRWMGQPLYLWPSPDGYPDTADAWANNLLPRWNFALALAHNAIEGVTVPWEKLVSVNGADTATDILHLFGGLLFGEPLDTDTISLLMDYVGDQRLAHHDTRTKLKEAVALLIASPRFQWM